MMELEGMLEIDNERGVVYFHFKYQKDANRFGTATPLRICQLPPIPERTAIDITHMVGVSYQSGE